MRGLFPDFFFTDLVLANKIFAKQVFFFQFSGLSCFSFSATEKLNKIGPNEEFICRLAVFANLVFFQKNIFA